MSRGVKTLRSIAFAAPFLGLAGACYGIVCLFARGWFWRFARWSPIQIEAALVATAAGLIVAIPAAVSYNVLRARLERFENNHASALLEAASRSYGFAQTLPLGGRFSRLPAFALIASPVLGILIPMVALMLHSPIPVGLPVHLLRVGVSDHDSSPIVVSIIGADHGGLPTVYVNSKEIAWSELDGAIRSQLQVRALSIVSVEGGNEVPWHLVAYPIDVVRGLHAEVVLLTAPPKVDPSHSPKAKTKNKAQGK